MWGAANQKLSSYQWIEQSRTLNCRQPFSSQRRKEKGRGEEVNNIVLLKYVFKSKNEPRLQNDKFVPYYTQGSCFVFCLAFTDLEKTCVEIT